MPKDFAKKDVHSEDDTRAAFRRRYDDSRTSLFDLDLDTAIPNPFNPRYPDDPDVIETAGSLKEVGQLQPVVVVTRDAFVEAYPELEGDEQRLPTYKVNKQGKKVAVKNVFVIGNRRYEGALLNEWQTMDAVLAPSVSTAAEIEDRVLHENIHRQQLPPLLEAQMLERKMRREKLSLRQVAEKIKKTHTYVDSRLALLKLLPEFQNLMQSEFRMASSERTLKLKLARDIAKLPKAQQLEIWEHGAPFQVAVIPADSKAAPRPPAGAGPTAEPVAQDTGSTAAGEKPPTSEPSSAPPPVPSATPPAEAETRAPVTPQDAAPQAGNSSPAPAAAAPEPPVSEPQESGPQQHWPLVIEAAGVRELAETLSTSLAEDDLAELVDLLI